jgi:DNA-binding CsgD family transcriptional regulator
MLFEEIDQACYVEAVGNSESLISALDRSEWHAVIFEAAGMPWKLDGVMGSLNSDHTKAVLVGTFPETHRQLSRHQGVLYVSRISSFASFRMTIDSPDPKILNSDIADLEQFAPAASTLSQRESQVLVLISAGLTTTQIADRLGMSSKTVENRKQSIFSKLGVQNQSHAVAVAMRTGLLATGSTSPMES